MRLVITGATGNIGTAVLELVRQAGITSVTAIARRHPAPAVPYDRADWLAFDLAAPSSVPRMVDAMRGATAVVHLAWDIVAPHRREMQHRSNITGTRNVVTAAVEAGAPHLVFLSSVAAYAPDPTHQVRVDEGWPLGGFPRLGYSADKVAMERLLECTTLTYPGLRVATLRAPAVLQPAAASETARYLLGPLGPVVRWSWLRPRVLPLPGVTIQVVHAADVADLICRVVREGASGAFNVAAEPVLTSDDIAAALRLCRLPTHPGLLRAVMGASAKLRVQPLEASWFDLLTQSPLVSTRRAQDELGWRPTHHGYDVLRAVGEAAQQGSGAPSPRLAGAVARHRS